MTSQTKVPLHPIAVTLIVLVAYVVGGYIQFPFVDLTEFFQEMGVTPAASPIGKKLSFFPFRFVPYISATVLIIFLSGFVPPIKRLRKQHFKLQNLIFFTTLIFTLIQSLFLSNWLLTITLYNGDPIITIPPVLFHFLYGLWNLVGISVLIALMKWSTHKGVINGLALFFIFDTVAPYITMLKNEIMVHSINNSAGFFPILLAMAGMIYFTIAKKEVPIVKGERKLTIPLHYNIMGTIPFQFGAAVVWLPMYLFPHIFTEHVQIIYITVMAAMAVHFVAHASYSRTNTVETLSLFGFRFADTTKENQEQYLRNLYKKIIFINTVVVAAGVLCIYYSKPIHFHVSALFSLMPITLFFTILYARIVDSLETYKTRNDYTELAELDTVLEARLLSEILKSEDIPVRIHNTRFIEITGSRAFWDLSMPTIPSFTIFPEIAGGTLSVYVHKDHIEHAEKIMDAQLSSEE